MIYGKLIGVELSGPGQLDRPFWILSKIKTCHCPQGWDHLDLFGTSGIWCGIAVGLYLSMTGATTPYQSWGPFP